MIDDSALLHRREYDPAKAREYYLRTRRLKGRQRGIGEQSTSRLGGGQSPGSSPRRGREQRGTKPANAKLEEQKAALEARLDRLREVLADLVEAAKKRSGVETKEEKKSDKESKEKEPESKDKADKKLTAKEKREAAKRSKEHREKNKTEKPDSAAKEVRELQEQIKDIKKDIQKALEKARKQALDKQRTKTASKGR